MIVLCDAISIRCYFYVMLFLGDAIFYITMVFQYDDITMITMPCYLYAMIFLYNNDNSI